MCQLQADGAREWLNTSLAQAQQSLNNTFLAMHQNLNETFQKSNYETETIVAENMRRLVLQAGDARLGICPNFYYLLFIFLFICFYL